jgi:hypothetical protein
MVGVKGRTQRAVTKPEYTVQKSERIIMMIRISKQVDSYAKQPYND